MKDIIFVHLLNDFSGSPKVLRAVIEAVKFKRGKMRLYVGGGEGGFLSDCGIHTVRYGYSRSNFKVVTLFAYFFSQIRLIFQLFLDRSIDKNTVIYINTLLPFGAAVVGALKGCRVIYHVHEVSIQPTLLKNFLTMVAGKCSGQNIYVSHTHMKTLPIDGVPASCVYNSLSESFFSEANSFKYKRRHAGKFKVLMLASLRNYKGLNELIALAKSVDSYTDIEFNFVANEGSEQIVQWCNARQLPDNIVIHHRTIDTSAFYRQTNVVLNLSRVDQWVETFGLTILEAMAFGLPVIVPPVGGPAELVSDEVEGFLVDSRDLAMLRDRLLQLYNDDALCEQMSCAGKQRAATFKPNIFSDGINSIIIGPSV